MPAKIVCRKITVDVNLFSEMLLRDSCRRELIFPQRQLTPVRSVLKHLPFCDLISNGIPVREVGSLPEVVSAEDFESHHLKQIQEHSCNEPASQNHDHHY